MPLALNDMTYLSSLILLTYLSMFDDAWSSVYKMHTLPMTPTALPF